MRRALGTMLGVFVVGAVLYSLMSRPGGTAGGNQGDTVRIVYRLTGSAASASLTYTNGSGNTEQQADKAVPLSLTFNVPHGAFVYFSAQNQTDRGDLACAIEADGETITNARSSGAYTIVSCSTMAP